MDAIWWLGFAGGAAAAGVVWVLVINWKWGRDALE